MTTALLIAIVSTLLERSKRKEQKELANIIDRQHRDQNYREKENQCTIKVRLQEDIYQKLPTGAFVSKNFLRLDDNVFAKFLVCYFYTFVVIGGEWRFATLSLPKVVLVCYFYAFVLMARE